MKFNNEEAHIYIPLVLNVHDSKLQNLLTLTLIGHGSKGSAAEHQVSVIVGVEIGDNHSGPFFCTQTRAFTSYLQQIKKKYVMN